MEAGRPGRITLTRIQGRYDGGLDHSGAEAMVKSRQTLGIF